ncbi:hypothetical protein FLM52_11420 [bacterium Scap17]|nr:hypothetical protein [bacterium Scap17]
MTLLDFSQKDEENRSRRLGKYQELLLDLTRTMAPRVRVTGACLGSAIGRDSASSGNDTPRVAEQAVSLERDRSLSKGRMPVNILNRERNVVMSGYRFCTQCGGASVHRVKRQWWQRLAGKAPLYHCEDCGIIHRVSTEAITASRTSKQDAESSHPIADR